MTKTVESVVLDPTGIMQMQMSCPLLQFCCDKKKGDIHVLPDVKCAPATFFSGWIRGGSRVAPGKFPFLTALVYTENVEFFCGGSLITDKHVLTAAHCMQQKHSQNRLDPGDVLVLLGRHNIALQTEPKAEKRGVRKILIHEDWRFDSTKYDADLAILAMDRSVTFSRTIRPICMISSEEVSSLSNGTVVDMT